METTSPLTQAPPAFAEFFARHRERLSKACLLLTGFATDAEDLAQGSMSRVLERWDRVSRMDSPDGYLYRTALNLHRNALKRMSRAARRQLGGVRITDEGTTDRGLDIRRAVGTLPVAQRQALVLIEWLGFTAEEAAPILGIDPASVRGRLHRARIALRERLGGIDE